MSKRKLNIGTLLCALFLLTAPALHAESLQINLQDTLNLTLDDALSIALSENPTIRVADREIEKQEYAKKGTYASLFPQIDFTASYQRAIKRQMVYMGIEGMDDGFQMGRENTYSTGFIASMPVISVPLWKSLKISAYDVELAVEKARSSRIEMIDQVKRAFYGVLLARDAYDVYKQAYDNAVFNYKEIERKYEQGLLAEYDLIRANVNVKNAEPNMYDAENSLILGHWQLKALIGLDLNMEIACIGSLSDYEQSILGDYLNIDLTLAGNSDLKQLELQDKQLDKTIQMYKAQYYPSLALQFNYNWTSMNDNFKFKDYKWDPYSMLGVSVTIPIFSGGKRYADVKKTKITKLQLADQRLNTERQLNVAAKQYKDQMSTCIKQYQAATAGVEQSEKSYAITMKRYETGEGTMLEINDAQLSLTQAQLNLNQSIYNYMVAKSGLERTLGSNY